MAVDKETVKRVARLARLHVEDNDLESLAHELDSMLQFTAQLDEVNIEGVEPLTSIVDMQMKMRADEVTETDQSSLIMQNAPAEMDNYFLVPKVVE